MQDDFETIDLDQLPHVTGGSYDDAGSWLGGLYPIGRGFGNFVGQVGEAVGPAASGMFS
jgi:hypothetical protein